MPDTVSQQLAATASAALERNIQQAAARADSGSPAAHAQIGPDPTVPAAQLHTAAEDACEVDSLDVLIAAGQCGPPSLQCIAAQALLPPTASGPAAAADLSSRSMSMLNGMDRSVHHSPEAGLLTADAVHSPAGSSASSLQCDVCSGTWRHANGVGPGSSGSSGCSICAARQRHGTHLISAEVQTSRAASPDRAPAVRQAEQQGERQSITADCWARTAATADAAVGRSRPGTATGTGDRERKPAAMPSGKRRCVPAGDGAEAPPPQPEHKTGSASTAELPWPEQLRQADPPRQRKRALKPVGRGTFTRSGGEAGSIPSAANAQAAPEPAAGQQQPQAAGSSVNEELSRRMTALEAKVASWSIPQVR